jgi:tetratricopeptide (TPR) repeat protein
MIMITCHAPKRRCLGASLILTIAALTAFNSATAAAPAALDMNAALMTAEVALGRNDCKTASSEYLKAAQGSKDIKLAARASEVALGCGQFQTAEQATARWRQLASTDVAAVMNAIRAELGRARIAEARTLWTGWLPGDSAANPAVIVGAIEWLTERHASDQVLAMLRDAKHERMASANVQLRMAQLALEAYDSNLALTYADAAAKVGADANELHSIRMRAYGTLGRADEALREARALATVQPLAVGETLSLLGRDAEAHAELLKQRDNPQVRSLAERRLALQAFADGNYRDAEQRFTTLMRDQNTAALAVYYLAQIAELRGNREDAVRGYELLAESPMDAAARRRIAAIYLQDGERSQALRMVAAGDNAEVGDRINGELAQAELLGSAGAARDGVARLDAALQNFPGHPDVLYQRAVLLEKYDSNAAIAVLEAMAKARPRDMNVANALGFTLADHNRQLPRAENLIRAALATGPDNPAILDSLGWVLFRRGQLQAALAPLQRAFRLYRDGDIGAHLGEVFWKLNRQSDARAAWQQALAADPDNDYLVATAKRYAPDLQAPKPPPSVGNEPATDV